MMTKLFAVRLAESGIGVFEIRPGIIRTDMTAVVKEKYDRLIAEGDHADQALGRAAGYRRRRGCARVGKF